MADHGSIANCPSLTTPGMAVQAQAVYPIVHRCLRVLGAEASAERLAIEGRRDDGEGASVPPSLYLPKGGQVRFRFPVDAGTRSISVKAKQPSGTLPRPSIRILANASIGLTSDLSAAAPTGAGWVTIGPMTFVATAAGGVFLEVNAPWNGGESGCWFDAIIVK